jgi:hypothetical protein
MRTTRKTRSDKGRPASHGYSITHSKLYNIYFLMRRRCQNQTDPAYHKYGARGIDVCLEWQEPVAFCRWAVDNGYIPGLTLERVDNSKGYSPANCTWASRTAQARNRRSNRVITFDGRTQALAAWAEQIGISAHTLGERIRKTERAGDALDFSWLFSERWRLDRSGDAFPSDPFRPGRSADPI